MFAITLQPGEDWSRFCKAIGRSEMENDPRFDTLEKRSEEYSTEIVSLFDEIFSTKTRDELLNLGITYLPALYNDRLN